MKTFLLAALFIPLTALGKIGETQSKVRARYGSAKESFVDLGTHEPAEAYEKEGFSIVVIYKEGASICETVSKVIERAKDGTPMPGAGLSEAEIQALLKVYGDGLSWKKIEGKAPLWLRADKKVAAAYGNGQTIPGRNLSAAEAAALRFTPMLLFTDAAFAVDTFKKDAAKKPTDLKQAQEDKIATVFGSDQPKPSPAASRPTNTASGVPTDQGAHPSAPPPSLLGGTLKQCVERYGPSKPITPDRNAAYQEAYGFTQGAFAIRAQFVDQRVVSVACTLPNPFSNDQIASFLSDLAQGSSWIDVTERHPRKIPANFYRRYIAYQRADGKAIAEYKEFDSHNELLVWTAEFEETVRKSLAAQGY